jgi:hypothetical protein
MLKTTLVHPIINVRTTNTVNETLYSIFILSLVNLRMKK